MVKDALMNYALNFCGLVKKYFVDETSQGHLPTNRASTKRTESRNRASMICMSLKIVHETCFHKVPFGETIGILRKIAFSPNIAIVNAFYRVKNTIHRKSKECGASIVPGKLALWR